MSDMIEFPSGGQVASEGLFDNDTRMFGYPTAPGEPALTGWRRNFEQVTLKK
jgi:hypothetical protein